MAIAMCFDVKTDPPSPDDTWMDLRSPHVVDMSLRELLEKWWHPPAELISTLPKGGVSLQYLGHSDTTRALTECDPQWTWTPMGFDANRQPVLVLDDQGRPVGLWAWLTVCGVTRPAYGSCLPGKGEAIKELIGDAIRNGAMRFGVAGGLWSKADRDAPTPVPAKARQLRAQAKAATKPVQAAPETHHEAKPGTDAGRARYEALVEEYGAQVVNDCLATFGISLMSELSEAKVKQLRASLASRAIVVALQEDMDATQE